MRDQAVLALARLRSSPIFRNVGMPTTGGDIVQVTSWSLACEAHLSQVWQYFVHENRNVLAVSVDELDHARYQLWNETVIEIRAEVTSCVDAALVGHNVVDVDEVRNNARWSIMHAILEAEYADIVPLGFFSMLFEWYCLGHYPCGWDGEYPEGRLIIF